MDTEINMAYLVDGYEVGEEKLVSYLRDSVCNKYDAISKNGLTAALKEYYSATDNHNKVLVLKSILDNVPFVELKRLSRNGCRLFAMCQSEDDLPSSDEFPGNLSLARKLMTNGYDVYMLGNPNGIRSADFIATKKNMLYYLEGKTMNGQGSLDELLSKASSQSDKVIVDIIGTNDTRYISKEIKGAFSHFDSLTEIILFKGSRMITTTRQQAEGRRFEQDFKKIWIKIK